MSGVKGTVIPSKEHVSVWYVATGTSIGGSRSPPIALPCSSRRTAPTASNKARSGWGIGRPVVNRALYEQHFRCPVKFGAPRNMLVFDHADLARPFLTHNADVLAMLREAGFERVSYRNLTGGVAAIHSGWKI